MQEETFAIGGRRWHRRDSIIRTDAYADKRRQRRAVAAGGGPADRRQPAQPLLDLSVVIPVIDARSVDALLPQLQAELERLGVRFEILLLAADIAPIRQAAATHHARAIEVQQPAGSCAKKPGFAEAAGEYVLTMDADLSHPPGVIEQLWSERTQADLTIASRYAPGGHADMGVIPLCVSRI